VRDTVGTEFRFFLCLSIPTLSSSSSSSSSLLSLIFEISDSILSDWVSFLAYSNLFGIKDFVIVVVVLIPTPCGR
jgi:hypothetical protein